MPDRILYTRYGSPIGVLFIALGPKGITRLDIGAKEADFISGVQSATGVRPVFEKAPFPAVFRQLDEYFSGRPVRFDLPLAPAGTDFDKAVWKALFTIPWGKKVSYGQLASLIGKSGAARAVGGACGRNPVPIIIPCHRVLQADGSIGGYSGGAGIKEKLLHVEGIPFKAR